MYNNSIYDLDFDVISQFIPNSRKIDGFLLAGNGLNPVAGVRTQKTPHPICLHLYLYMICTEGDADIKVNFKTYKLTKNTVVFLMKNDVFEILDFSDDFKSVAVISSSSLREDYHKGDTVTVLSIRNKLQENPIIKLTEKTYERSMFIVSLMKDTIEDGDISPELMKPMITALHGALTCVLMSKMEEVKTEGLTNLKLSRKEMIFRNFINNVEQYYKKERQITFYANLEFITPKYLSTVVYEVSNRHAGDWINEYVIFEAKKLLGSEFLSIQEICYKLNFSNQSFFGKYFKRHTGMSPLEFRKSVAK